MQSETARIEAFSDGVFAIAITLLILDLKVPPGNVLLGSALVRQWPSYIAYLISFWFIGIMWVNHHRLFTHIHKSNNGLLFLNLLLLLGISAVPFPTALVAAHFYTPDRTLAVAVFNGMYVVLALFFNVLWRYIVRAGLLNAAMLESADSISRQYAVGPAAYLICFGLTWVSVAASLAINVALAVFFAIPPRVRSQESAAIKGS
jgi:uncharacterized membrane protein